MLIFSLMSNLPFLLSFYIHLNFGQTILFILGLTSHLKEGIKFVMYKKLLFWMETIGKSI